MVDRWGAEVKTVAAEAANGQQGGSTSLAILADMLLELHMMQPLHVSPLQHICVTAAAPKINRNCTLQLQSHGASLARCLPRLPLLPEACVDSHSTAACCPNPQTVPPASPAMRSFMTRLRRRLGPTYA